MSNPSLQSAQWRVDLTDLSQACRILSHTLNLEDQENHRVQWDLQPRLIRYYTTLGLLDRACEKRGKAMFYGPRHLFQLLSIKRLQSQGLSLAEVQSRLLGASDEDMLSWLELPGAWFELIQEHQWSPPPATPDCPDRSQDFWLQSRPYQPPPPTAREANLMVRFLLPNGTEVLIPQEAWERHPPEHWSQWMDQSPQ